MSSSRLLLMAIWWLNVRKRWTEEDIAKLLRLKAESIPIQIMRMQLGRSEAAIQGQLRKCRTADKLG